MRLVAGALVFLAVQIASVRGDVLTFDIAAQSQQGDIAGSISLEAGTIQNVSANLSLSPINGASPTTFNIVTSVLGLRGFGSVPPFVDILLSADTVFPAGIDYNIFAVDTYRLSLAFSFSTNAGDPSAHPVSSVSGVLDFGEIDALFHQFHTLQEYSVSGTATLVTDVPEPATWALLVLGFVLVGGVTQMKQGRKPHGRASVVASSLKCWQKSTTGA